MKTIKLKRNLNPEIDHSRKKRNKIKLKKKRK
jgi:hypothetical protein